MDSLYLGTCSWKYPSWDGLVYSSREPENYLSEYSKKYKSVEIDQWFWSLGKSGASLPRRETVIEYDSSTPHDFKFAVKCPNAITLTHFYAKKGEPLQSNPRFLDIEFFLKFIGTLDPLIPKIGLFIFQFEYLNKEKILNRGEFIEKLESFIKELPIGLLYAIEIRNPRWIDREWFDFLNRNNIAPILLQGYWMDDIAITLDKYKENLGNTICLRLHGEDREGMEERSGEDWSKIIRSKSNELSRIIPALLPLLEPGKKTFIYVNNHYEGSAPKTIEKIENLLRENHIE
jgi:uncharacterized protein YecE (DUF72 family)